MSIPKFWAYSQSETTAISNLNKTSTASASATSKGNDRVKTIQLASKLSLELSQQKAIKNLIKNGEIFVENLDSSTNSVISPLENVIYYVPNLKYVTSWRGVKVVDNENEYVFTGSGYNDVGTIYLGSKECKDPTKFTSISYPNSISTAPYNSYYDSKKETYNIVGSVKFDSSNNYGFIYEGKLNEIDLNDPLNFTIIRYKLTKNTFIHDVANINVCVGNTQTPEGVAFSYIYDKRDGSFTDILFPGSLTTTTYGIIYNGGDSYTITGGYSEKRVDFDQIYNTDGIPKPYGFAYVADYDISTKTFSKWSPVILVYSQVAHSEGISFYFEEKDIYTISYCEIKNNIEYAYIIKLKRETNLFKIIDFRIINDINYGGISSASNSVANTILVGITSGGINPYNKSGQIPYQSLVTDF